MQTRATERRLQHAVAAIIINILFNNLLTFTFFVFLLFTD